MVKTRKFVSLAIIVLALCVVNSCLDYSAICSFFDIDMFGNEKDPMGLTQALAFVVSVGCAATLFAIPQFAAKGRAKRPNWSTCAWLAFCAIVAVILACLRALADASSTSVGVDGTVTSGLTAKGIVFVLVMLVLSIAESLISYKRSVLKIGEERIQLLSCAKRLEEQKLAIGDRKRLVDDVAGEMKLQAISAADSAIQSLYDDLLKLSGDLQNEFLGYAQKIEESHTEAEKAIKELSAEAKACTVENGLGDSGSGNSDPNGRAPSYCVDRKHPGATSTPNAA